MFPKGVLYEGVSDQPTFYRGESGANDSIVPSADNFLQLTENMPSNPLTEILKDFRTYRPVNHNQWLTWVETEARSKNVREYCSKDTTSAGKLFHDYVSIQFEVLNFIYTVKCTIWPFWIKSENLETGIGPSQKSTSLNIPSIPLPREAPLL